MVPSDKLAQVVDWLDLPMDTRPQLITAYIPDIDHAGHKGGPFSTEVEEALNLVDHFIGGLVESLAQRNLSEIINVVIVSDHGESSD
jgi:predicted AlkP superfamily pyrophosphatase or phosphodiesterase